MLYQKIIMGETPYHIRVGNVEAFEEHRHADIEFNYCLHGEFDMIVDKNSHCIHAGELVLINPMVSHSILPTEQKDSRILSATLGASFLRKYFSLFSKNQFRSTVCVLSPSNEAHQKLRNLLDESARLSEAKDAMTELMLMGVLYQICACLISEIEIKEPLEASGKDLRMVENIEKALEMIHYRYAEPLTVEDAAKATGYGKSNFCKIFKDIVGDTFHNLLNRQRVESAFGFLSETVLPISEIAQEVGFSDSKTFCRVFKSIMGMTPGEYRNVSRR